MSTLCPFQTQNCFCCRKKMCISLHCHQQQPSELAWKIFNGENFPIYGSCLRWYTEVVVCMCFQYSRVSSADHCTVLGTVAQRLTILVILWALWHVLISDYRYMQCKNPPLTNLHVCRSEQVPGTLPFFPLVLLAPGIQTNEQSVKRDLNMRGLHPFSSKWVAPFSVTIQWYKQ